MRNLIVALAALLLTGCATVGKPISADALAAFTPGVTTAADVTRALGAPGSSYTANGETYLSYVYSATHVNAAAFIPVAGALVARGNNATALTMFHFDAAGKLVEVTRADAASQYAGPLAGKP